MYGSNSFVTLMHNTANCLCNWSVYWTLHRRKIIHFEVTVQKSFNRNVSDIWLLGTTGAEFKLVYFVQIWILAWVLLCSQEASLARCFFTVLKISFKLSGNFKLPKVWEHLESLPWWTRWWRSRSLCIGMLSLLADSLSQLDHPEYLPSCSWNCAQLVPWPYFP